MTFHIGQSVVCVNDVPSGPETKQLLHKGEIYTVAWCGSFTSPIGKGTWIGVHLCGVQRPPGKRSKCVVPYGADRFRPVIERKTDISIFTRMLTPEKEGVQR